jgi:probable rRNA maturation factor
MPGPEKDVAGGAAVTVSRRGAPRSWLLPFSRSELRSALEIMLRRAGKQGHGLELVIAADREMEELHARCLCRPGPTNILSFPARGTKQGIGPGARPAFLGSLVLSADTLVRECFLYGQKPEEHCIRLLAHGLAHLLGLEHGPAMRDLAGRLESGAAAVLLCRE